MNTVTLFHNIAASGSACAFLSLPTHGKWLFTGVRIINTVALLAEYPNNLKEAISKLYTVDPVKMFTDSINQATAFLRKQLLQTINPTFQVKSNTNLIFVKSVQITSTTGILAIFCGARSQGIYALDSEIFLKANTLASFTHCVATHGGAIALYGVEPHHS